MCDMSEPRAAEQRRGGRRVGEIERLTANPDVSQASRPRALERDIIVWVEAVHGDDFGAVLVQALRQVHADKARRAGYQDLHAGIFMQWLSSPGFLRRDFNRTIPWRNFMSAFSCRQYHDRFSRSPCSSARSFAYFEKLLKQR